MTAPTTTMATPSDWRRAYARLLVGTDVFIVLWAVFGAQYLWFGTDAIRLSERSDTFTFTISYTLVSTTIAVMWLIALSVAGTRESRIVGAGPEEYRRVTGASLQLFGLLAILAFAFQIELSRGYLLVALPAGLAALVLERWIWRQWLGSVRMSGAYSARCVVIGSSSAIDELVSTLDRERSAGYHVVAACTSTPDVALQQISGGQILTELDQLRETMAEHDIDTVVVTGGHGFTSREISELSWSLTPGEHHLVMAPTLMDLAGPRIHTRPVAGLPLIHVETPRYAGASKYAKRLFDLIGASALILALSPILVAAAIIVKVTSKGPVLFTQTRIGRDGEPFRMLKFRSMRVGADAELAALLKAQGTEGQPLFKIKNDPRITWIGHIIRRTSIDELPQLFNVVGGSMSLVGPRPQVPAETALYDDIATRRLLVRPGLTGLWQVSGRSSLSWEDAIRLDLHYVENWSLTGDIVLLWRTVKAVIARDGAV